MSAAHFQTGAVLPGYTAFGVEVGPFLVKIDASGTVQKVIQTPDVLGLGSNPFVQSPSSPISTGAVNLPGSGGFEGMALNASYTKLHTMLERPLTTDTDQKRLLVQEFDLATETFNGNWFGYRLDVAGNNIGDMTAIDASRFLVIERNGGAATSGTAVQEDLPDRQQPEGCQRLCQEDRTGRPDEHRRPRRPER